MSAKRSSSPARAPSAFVEPLERRQLMSAAAGPHGAPPPRGPAANDPRVFAPGERVRGETTAQLAAEWWRWATSFQVGPDDAPTNPLFDQTGAIAHLGDVGKAFFLAGLIDFTDDTPFVADAVRDIRLPTGTPVFFPVVNFLGDNVGVAAPLTADELLGAVAQIVDTAAGLHVSLDGSPVAITTGEVDEAPFRVQSGPFRYVLPQEDNLYQHFGYTGEDGRGLVSPAVTDGYWVALKPLAPGHHTLNFGGTIEASDFTIDLTYHIQVVPQGQYNKDPAAPPVFSSTPIGKTGRLADGLLS